MGSEFVAGSVKSAGGGGGAVGAWGGGWGGGRWGGLRRLWGTNRWKEFYGFSCDDGDGGERVSGSGGGDGGLCGADGGSVGDGEVGGAGGAGLWCRRRWRWFRRCRCGVADFRENPWYAAVQWTAGTPAEGMTCELVVVDTVEALGAIKARGLVGKVGADAVGAVGSCGGVFAEGGLWVDMRVGCEGAGGGGGVEEVWGGGACRYTRGRGGWWGWRCRTSRGGVAGGGGAAWAIARTYECAGAAVCGDA